MLGVVELGAAASIGLQQEGKLCEVNGGYNFEPPALMLLSLHGVCTAYLKALRATQYDKGACIQNWKLQNLMRKICLQSQRTSIGDGQDFEPRNALGGTISWI